MKVVWINNIPSPYRVEFFNELGKHIELTVIFERDSADDRNNEWFENSNKNFRCIYLNGRKCFKDQSLSLDIIKVLKSLNYDFCVLGVYSSPTQILANLYLRFLKRKFIISSDGGFIKKDRTISKLLKKFLISGANAWLSTGECTTKYLEYYGANKNKIFKYPFTSINNEDIVNEEIIDNINKKKELKRELGVNEDKVILAIGQFIYRKGFDILIKALDSISNDAACYIIGGKTTEEYYNLIKSNSNNKIYFIEFQKKEIVKKYYQIADVFVLPTREDIWGLVINEAMANGVPVITTDRCIAGIELIEDNVNGYIIKNEDILSLREKIVKILNDKKLQKSMRYANKEKIKEYTIETMTKRHVEIFNELNMFYRKSNKN